jgi:hypothetical protein
MVWKQLLLQTVSVLCDYAQNWSLQSFGGSNVPNERGSEEFFACAALVLYVFPWP